MLRALVTGLWAKWVMISVEMPRAEMPHKGRSAPARNVEDPTDDDSSLPRAVLSVPLETAAHLRKDLGSVFRPLCNDLKHAGTFLHA